MLVFRQFFDPQSSTYTYLLGDLPSGESVLIEELGHPGAERVSGRGGPCRWDVAVAG